MPNVYVDIDVDDFYDEMSSFDKREMVELLDNDGFITQDEYDDGDDEFKIENPNVLDEMWGDVIKKLFHGRIQLSLEDEETIRKIANKL